MIPFRYIATGLLGAACLSLQAQEKALTVEQCVNQALENSLLVKSGQLAVGKSRDLQKTAFELEKTSISFSQDLTSGGGPDNGITLSQGFDYPTVYKARRSYLEAETTVASSQIDVVRNELVKGVSENYYAWVHARHTIAILQKQDSIYRQFVQLATARYNAGETNYLELMNAQRLQNENNMELQKAQKSCKTFLFNLQQLMNSEAEFVPADTTLAPLPTDQVRTTTFSETPLGRNYQARIASSERNVTLAKQDFMPSFSVGLTLQAVITGLNPYNVDRSWFDKGALMSFEIGVSVPLFRGSQRAKVRAARKDVEIAKNERLIAEQQLSASRREAYNQYQRAKQTLDYYTTQGIAQAQRMAELAQVEYEHGEIGYVEFMQNQTSALDVQIRYADAVNEYNQAIINLNYINGNNK